ncbi:hypothetical protein OR1_02864 [Geobacter sp. OR-1]|nr:hypothetical protein OR1_02864 [Geobacter sp. OR-1]
MPVLLATDLAWHSTQPSAVPSDGLALVEMWAECFLVVSVAASAPWQPLQFRVPPHCRVLLKWQDVPEQVLVVLAQVNVTAGLLMTSGEPSIWRDAPPVMMVPPEVTVS